MRHMIASRLNSLLYNPDASAAEQYHIWFYTTKVWERTKWMDVTTYKSPSDMWNYQDILSSLKPGLISEFVTAFGVSALFFAAVIRQIGHRFRILSLIIHPGRVVTKIKSDPDIELL